MVRKAARLAYPEIQLEFHTEHSRYKITNDSGNTVGVAVGQNSGVLSNAVVQAQTKNTLGDDIGTFSVIVSGQSIRWDKILNVNDVVIIRMTPNEVEAKQPVFNTNVFTGLVSEIGVIGQYGENSLMFQISGQSFQKAFTQYKIGLISQVEQLISNMGWLWDMNAQLDPIVHGSGAGGGKGGYLAVGSYSKQVASQAKAVAKAVGGKLGIDPKLVFAQIGQETGMKQNNLTMHNNLSGITYAGQKGAYRGSHQPADENGGWYAYFKNLGYYAGTYYDILKRDLGGQKPKSCTDFANILYSKNYFTADPSVYANGMRTWAAQYGGTKSKKGALSDGSSSDGDSDSSGDKGEVNSTAGQIKREEQNSVGVPFFGNTVATIENNLIKRFKPYMVYSYDNGKKTLWDFLDYSNMQSWTDYEYLLDSSQFSNANGSLWDLMQNALRIPFNEMFFDSTADGHSKLVVRRTPFNPEDWNRLTRITVDSNDIIDNEVGKTDIQQYSVFVVNPASPTMMGIEDGMLLSAYPQTSQQLINFYGYSKYEVDDLYLSGRTGDNNKEKKAKEKSKKDSKSKSKSKDKSKSDSKSKGKKDSSITKDKSSGRIGAGSDASKDNTKGTYYKEKDVAKYLNSIGDNILRLNKNKYAKALADLANNISAAQAYDLINTYCANGYIMNKETYDSVLQVDTGGGLPNTGTEDASFKNMTEVIKKAGGDETAFMSIAKSTIKNVSDEFLRQVWQARGENGKITKKAYQKVYDTSRDVGDYTGDTAATDLKIFTRTLFNWYADNYNFYSGNIRIAGNPDVRVGCILDVVDFLNKKQYGYPGMRYYIESVTQNYSFTDGYATDVGVTRGMKMPVGNNDDPRFDNLWGTSMDYKGGYMGEATTSDLALAVSTPDADSTVGSAAFGGAKGNEIAVKAAKFGYTFRKDGNPKINGHKVKEVYSFGHKSERGSKSPLTHDLNQGTIALDCSSFVYWCFKHYGATIGMDTTAQANGSQFKKVNVGQSSKNMKVGDLVFMLNCGHVMFYIGNGKLMGWNGKGSWDTSGGCQIQSLSTVKSWAHGIDGYVARFK